VGLFIAAAVLVLLFGFAAFFGAPYVPSRRRYVERALTHLYELNRDDVLVDIGSGDGVVLRVAAKRGARAVGYEINPVLVVLSKLLTARFSNVEVHFANFWTAKLPAETTVVYAFSVLRDNKRLIKKLQKEATRLGRPLDLLCYGSPLEGVRLTGKYEAYYRYTISPLQEKKA
jgi:hypothetical protein